MVSYLTIAKAGPIFVFLALLIGTMLAGCGGGSDPTKNSDEDAVIGVLHNAYDIADDPASFKALFVEGAAPAEKGRLLLTKSHLKEKAKPTISGDTATIVTQVIENNGGKELGEVTWTFVKQGEKWKIKTAPLP